MGWTALRHELKNVKPTITGEAPPVVSNHLEAAHRQIARRAKHPKMVAVAEDIRGRVDAGEKVLVFCHHHATAAELTGVLAQVLGRQGTDDVLPEAIWSHAWNTILAKDVPSAAHERYLDQRSLVLEWLASPGVCSQVTSWLPRGVRDAKSLVNALRTTPARGSRGAPSIARAAKELLKTLTDPRSLSIQGVLRTAVHKSQRA